MLLVLKADLADRQREFQASKSDRTALEQQVWEADDGLKTSEVDHHKEEQRLNEIVREYENRVQELKDNDLEINR